MSESTPSTDSTPDAGKVIAHPATDETVKETIESIVIAFILAFIFRAFIIEAFIIPTGSMAPTLLGAHISADCPSCGYHFNTSLSRSHEQGDVLRDGTEAGCPMCWYPVPIAAGTRVRAGDRILVDKFLYEFTDPQRWDIVVFKNPQGSDANRRPSSQEPMTNYIKRLVGLPGERLVLLDGNVYVAPANAPNDSFKIARKIDPEMNRHWEKIQRAVWQPIYHSQYVPLSDARPGSDNRGDPARGRLHAWAPPWRPVQGQERVWQLGSAQRPQRRYEFLGGAGTIYFDFEPPGLATGHSGYNSVTSVYYYNRENMGANVIARENDDPIEDIRLAVSVMPQGDDAVVSLSTTARLDRPELGSETVVASVDSAGFVYLTVPMADGAIRELARPVQGPSLKPGVATPIELWVVDDSICVWVGGKLVVRHLIELTWQQVLQRPESQNLPEVQIHIDSDEPVTLARIELDRDVYYGDGNGGYAVDTVRRGFDGKIRDVKPLHLRTQTSEYDDEFFVLGDNSPASEDGRKWSDVNGWVKDRYFNGDHRPHVVPRSLLVGRAFYVYYPAPHPLTFRDKGIVPNFGDMRFIH